MLEDTMSAVDSLRSYHVKFFNMSDPPLFEGERDTTSTPSPTRDPTAVPSSSSPLPDTRSNTSFDVDERNTSGKGPHSESHSPSLSESTNSIPGLWFEFVDGLSQTLAYSRVRIAMEGREVHLYLHDEIVKKLPNEFQERINKKNCIMKFYPVLFTQVRGCMSVCLFVLC